MPSASAASSSPRARRSPSTSGWVRRLTIWPDGPLEVLRRAQRPLHAGAGDLQRVAAGDGVVVVELAGHDPGGQGDGVEVDAAGLVDADAQDAAGVLDVVDLEAEVGEQGCDESIGRVPPPSSSRAPPLALISIFSNERRGLRPRLPGTSQRTQAATSVAGHARGAAPASVQLVPPQLAVERADAPASTDRADARRRRRAARRISTPWRRRRRCRGRRRSAGSEPSGGCRQRTVMPWPRSAASPSSSASTAHGMRANPSRPPPPPRRAWSTSTVRASRRSVAAGQQVGLDLLEQRRDAPPPPPSRASAALVDGVPAHQRDLPAARSRGPDLDAHRHALQLPVDGPAPEAHVGAGVELDPHAGAPQLGGQRRRRLAGAVLGLHDAAPRPAWGRSGAAAAGRRRRRGP